MDDTTYQSLIGTYDLATLRQARTRLDADAWPARAALLDDEISRRVAGTPPAVRPASPAFDIGRDSVYAGLLFRLPALALDLLLVYVPFGMLLRAAIAHDALWALCILPFAWPIYVIACTARWGATAGKRLAGIMVVSAGGGRATLTQCMRRNLPDLLFAAGMSASLGFPLLAGAHLPGDTTSAATRLSSFRFQFPWWDRLDDWWDAWIWSQAFFLCLDQRRRSLHELLSATLVIRRQQQSNLGRDAPFEASYYDWLAGLPGRLHHVRPASPPAATGSPPAATRN